MVFVGSYNQKLHAFNSATGQPIWSAATGGHESSPAVASGLIYIGSAFNNVYAFDAATGQPVWTATTGGPIVSWRAVANGLVYVGSYDYKLHAFEAATGQVVWSAAPGSAVASSPAVASGVVYVPLERVAEMSLQEFQDSAEENGGERRLKSTARSGVEASKKHSGDGECE